MSKTDISGEASSWQAAEDASDAAWAAPGVTEVIDNIRVMAY